MPSRPTRSPASSRPSPRTRRSRRPSRPTRSTRSSRASTEDEAAEEAIAAETIETVDATVAEDHAVEEEAAAETIETDRGRRRRGRGGQGGRRGRGGQRDRPQDDGGEHRGLTRHRPPGRPVGPRRVVAIPYRVPMHPGRPSGVDWSRVCRTAPWACGQCRRASMARSGHRSRRSGKETGVRLDGSL